jgi:hypothetical protein
MSQNSQNTTTSPVSIIRDKGVGGVKRVDPGEKSFQKIREFNCVVKTAMDTLS